MSTTPDNGKKSIIKWIFGNIKDIVIAIGALAPFWTFLARLPAWYYWVAVPISILFALFWFTLKPRKSYLYNKTESIDVKAVLADVIPPEPVPEPKPIPAFHAYTSDDIDGLHWEWKWRDDATEPRPEMIDRLDCFCPKCELRIEPKNVVGSRTEEIDKPHPGILASIPKQRISMQVFRAEFACDNRCFTPITRNLDLISEMGRIKRMIEHRAKSKG